MTHEVLWFVVDSDQRQNFVDLFLYICGHRRSGFTQTNNAVQIDPVLLIEGVIKLVFSVKQIVNVFVELFFQMVFRVFILGTMIIMLLWCAW